MSDSDYAQKPPAHVGDTGFRLTPPALAGGFYSIFLTKPGMRINLGMVCVSLIILLGTTASAGAIDCASTIQSTTFDLSSTIICPGDGLWLKGGVNLDCHGRTIQGSGTGIGLHLTSMNNAVNNWPLPLFPSRLIQ